MHHICSQANCTLIISNFPFQVANFPEHKIKIQLFSLFAICLSQMKTDKNLKNSVLQFGASRDHSHFRHDPMLFKLQMPTAPNFLI